MFIRRCSSQQVFPARWNRAIAVGPCGDPLLEYYDGVSWVGVLPAEANNDVEVVKADASQLELVSMLTEYALRYATDFQKADVQPNQPVSDPKPPEPVKTTPAQGH